MLSAGYNETSIKLDTQTTEIKFLEAKKERYEENKTFYLTEKEQINESINLLREGLSNNKIQYVDKETGQLVNTTSSRTRKALEDQIRKSQEDLDKVNQQLETSLDSITSIDLQLLNIQSQSDLAKEIGPLKYLSDVLNKPMDNIVNVLLLIIVFVFDPLALFLLVASSQVFNLNKDTILASKKDQEWVVNFLNHVLN